MSLSVEVVCDDNIDVWCLLLFGARDEVYEWAKEVTASVWSATIKRGKGKERKYDVSRLHHLCSINHVTAITIIY